MFVALASFGIMAIGMPTTANCIWQAMRSGSWKAWMTMRVRSLIRWMSAGLLLLCVGAGAAIVAREPLAQIGASFLLNGAGIPVRSLEVTQVGLDHIRLKNVALGGENGPSAKRVDITWTAKTLAASRAARIDIGGPALVLSYADGQFDIDGLVIGKSGSGGIAPFDRLSIASANIVVHTPWGQAKLQGNGEIVGSPKGILLMSADLVSASMGAPGRSVSLANIDFKSGKPAVGTIKVENIDLKSLPALANVDGASELGTVTGKIPFRLYLSDNGMGFVRLEIDRAELSVATTWGIAELVGNLVMASGSKGIVLKQGHLTSARANVAGGRLSLADVVFTPDQPVDATLKLEHIDLQTLLTMIDVKGLSGSGSITGNIPIHIDENGVSVSDGRMAAAGSGILRYSGAALPQELPGADGRAANSVALARDALADFHYSVLTLVLDRAFTGEGSLTIKMEGANPRVLENHPFVLNIRLETNFDKLAQILLDGYAQAGRLMRGAASR